MKKIMLLGGSAQQVIAIEKARQMGYQTILCDYLRDNPGQYVTDKFYPVSTTDREAILDLAEHEQINGILAYASDPAAPTAAYVAEKLGLPTNPYQSVTTLCDKDAFRKFLRENGLSAPKSSGYTSLEAAVMDIGKYHLPVIVKPVDSSGSKGVTVVHTTDDLENAITKALSFSRTGRIIIEEFIKKKHPYLIGGDIFVLKGRIVLWGLMNCHRDEMINPLVPVGKSYPLELSDADIRNVKDMLQEIVDKLHISFGAMNVEIVVDKDGNVWPIDIGPRNGGNMIPELLGLIFDIDVVAMSVRAAMGDMVYMDVGEAVPYYATHNLHSDRDGIFEGIFCSEELKSYIVKSCIYKRPGDRVEYFDNASKALGILFLKFHDGEEMKRMLSDINKHVKIRMENGLEGKAL